MKKQNWILAVNLLIMFMYEIAFFSFHNVVAIIYALFVHSGLNLIAGLIYYYDDELPNEYGREFIASTVIILGIGFPMCFVGGLSGFANL